MVWKISRIFSMVWKNSLKFSMLWKKVFHTVENFAAGRPAVRRDRRRADEPVQGPALLERL
jgi:hypothetical protein